MPVLSGIGIPINALILMEKAIIQSWCIHSIYKPICCSEILILLCFQIAVKLLGKQIIKGLNKDKNSKSTQILYMLLTFSSFLSDYPTVPINP